MTDTPTLSKIELKLIRTIYFNETGHYGTDAEALTYYLNIHLKGQSNEF